MAEAQIPSNDLFVAIFLVWGFLVLFSIHVYLLTTTFET